MTKLKICVEDVSPKGIYAYLIRRKPADYSKIMAQVCTSHDQAGILELTDTEIDDDLVAPSDSLFVMLSTPGGGDDLVFRGARIFYENAP